MGCRRSRGDRDGAAAGPEPGPQVRVGHVRSHDGTELAFHEAGLRRGPPVAIANGLGGSIYAWRALVERLGQRYRFVSWDYRGLYGSAAPADTGAVRVEDHVRDFEVVLAEAGVVRPVVVGWSMGVQVALQYALDHPDGVAGLVLVCGAPGDPFAGVFHTTASRRLVPALCRSVETVPVPFSLLVRGLAELRGTPGLLRRIGIVAPSCDLELLGELARRLSAIDWRVYGRSIRAMAHHDAWSRLGEIVAPVLTVGGTRDLITPPGVASSMAAAVVDGESLVIDGATHYAPLEFADVLIDGIARFLTERVGTTGAEWRRKEVPDVVEPLGRRAGP